MRRLKNAKEMENQRIKPRIEWIDTAKGICILLVVYSHVYMGDHPAFLHFQDYFRMPLYFLLSGLFFKTYNNFHNFFIKKTNKLLIPFVFAYIFLSTPMLFFLQYRAGLPVTFPSDFWEVERWRFLCKGNGTLWFLCCLFILNIAFYAIFLISRHKTKLIIVCSMLIGLISFGMGRHEIFIPLWGDAALTALPFFLFGYILRNKSNILYEPFGKKHWVICALSFSVLMFIYLYNSDFERIKIELIHGDNYFEVDCLSMYLGGFCGTLFVLMIAKRLNHVPLVSYLGRYSIVILLTHVVLIILLRITLYHFNINIDYIHLIMLGLFIIVVLIEIPIIKFCIKYLPYVFAQKDLL